MTPRYATDRVAAIQRNGRQDLSPIRPFEVQRVAARYDDQTHPVKAGLRMTVLPGADIGTQHVAVVTLAEHAGMAADTAEAGR